MSQLADVPPPKPRRKRRKLVIVAVIIIAVLAGAAKLNAPSHGTIVAHPQPLPKKQTTAKLTAPTTVTNSYFDLPLPAGYTTLGSGTPASGVLFNQTITKNITLGRLIIAIAIKPTADGGYTNDSSYQLRSSQPQRYHFSNLSAGDQTVMVANDAQSAAVVAFWPHGNVTATISLTVGFDGPPTDGNSEEIGALQTIVNAWQWR